MTPQPSERLNALDAVRGIALLLGVVFHAAFSFLPGPQLWPVIDASRSPVLAGLLFVIHAFRMITFFLIAGFFAHLSLHRRGAWGFVGDRLKRIALPLLVGWPIVFFSISVVVIWAFLAAHGGVVPKTSPAPPPITVQTFPLTHLWFLYVLLLLYAATLILRGLVVLVDGEGALRRGLDRLLAWMIGNWAPVLLAAPLAAALFVQPAWIAWFGVPTPDTGFVPSPPAVVAFGGAFALGYLLHRQAGRLEVWRKRWALNLGVAVLCLGAALSLIGPQPLLGPITDDRLRLVYAALYALGAWSAAFALIGFALQFLSGYSAIRRYLADASYWIYLVHLPLVMALQVLVSASPRPWVFKFPAILAVALAVMLLSYQLLVRHSFVGAVLNGPRPRRARTEADAAAAAAPQPAGPAS